MRQVRPRAVLIAGPTASGKSALAMTVAERIGGAVVNADSMQVYRELAIVTARPTAEDAARVPHRLYGHVPAATAYSVASWRADMQHTLAALEAAGQPAVVVGGTGLYFRCLTEGLSAVPEIPDEVRTAWRQRGLSEPAAALHAELDRRDPDMAARLRSSDAQRILRALEVIDATGRSLADWQAAPGLPPLLDGPGVERIVLAIDRAELHRRIDRRFEAMVAAGALDEVAALDALGLDPNLPAMRAIGVKPLIMSVRGEITLEEAIRRGQAESRQYAKRQETWFRNQMADWPRRAVSAPA
ncbi:tRNA (adenosine(37)-N6)-dimethylallyltransferase MiaA [Prosthecodimorpha staleyi]|uniref:tRNA dimethylallyltransferase n=1 Tax=Prosthecodimorpha staleyi TaxID=2840188 RepID=A0A947D6V1_9HYPH|nr:tRNA (adenosine(37)-N6)-dimethylallyltransferase MiaA [Prosthecodimorpha staleyi]MBT9291428.1 tRNA (adenosine(37)-N6)-dimethylallyltransferase MiaA [Prosthecodimorpha staleyi]